LAVQVRRATADDLPQLLNLLPQLATDASGTDPYDIPEDRASRAFDEIEADNAHALLVAEDGGRVIGTLHLVIVPNLTHHAHPWAAVENLVVDASRRRSGVAHKLLEDAVRRAREAGCYKVQLLSRSEREEAHSLYGSLGFEASAVGFRLYMDI
jgi:N-acetylglutamate synthase-like GNAT family acetyltransferase